MFHLFLVVYENVSSSMEMIRVNSLVKSSKPSTLPVSLRQEFILTRSSLPHHGWSRTACHVCNVVVPLTRPTSASLLSHDAAQRLMGFFFLIVQHHYYRSCTLWRHQKPVFFFLSRGSRLHTHPQVQWGSLAFNHLLSFLL